LVILTLISFFGGFLTSSILDTSLGEFNEWAIVGSALVVACIEAFNNLYYYLTFRLRKKVFRNSKVNQLMATLNYFKIGVVYGLIVDGFKLGS
jgi:flagellar motor component MotA